MKLVSGWHNGVTGPEALVDSAARAFDKQHMENMSNLRMKSWPVVIEGTTEIAFWTTYVYDQTEDTDDYALNECKIKAELLVNRFNHTY